VKACPACSHVGDETYCPECRKHGKVSLMRDKRGLEAMLDQMRKQAHWIKQAIKALEDRGE
jgi:ribosomal protein L44E